MKISRQTQPIKESGGSGKRTVREWVGFLMTEPGSTFRIYDSYKGPGPIEMYRECFGGTEFIAKTPVEILDSEPVKVYYNNNHKGENAIEIEHDLFVKYEK